MPQPDERPRGLTRRAALIQAVPEGTLPVGVGLVIAGLTSYAFLVVSARALGPARYSTLSALWALTFVAGPGFFVPFEQELGRGIAARQVLGQGAGHLIRRAGAAAGGLVAVLLAATAIAAPALLHHLFDRSTVVLIAFACSLVAVAVQFVTRGVLSGTRRFRPYGGILAGEGLIRLGGCIALVAIGTKAVGPFALVVGLSPLLASFAGTSALSELHDNGDPSPWGEITSALGWLLAGSILSQVLLNAGTLAVKALASPREQAVAGKFLACLILVRVPLFLFQAIQAPVIPRLARLAESGDGAGFRRGVRDFLAAVTGIGLVALLGAATVGPLGVRILFGADFVLGRGDLVLLAAASGAFLFALAGAQVLIAVAEYPRAVVAWAVGIAAFVAVTAVTHGLLFRVEMALLVGSGLAAVTAGALLTGTMRAGGAHDASVPDAFTLPTEP